MAIETQNQLNHIAAQNDPALRFASVDGISGISAKHSAHADLFNRTLESASVLTPTAGQALLSGMGVALATGSGLAGGLVGAGVALHTVFSGSKKGTREL